jgi:hypothetical protein
MPKHPAKLASLHDGSPPPGFSSNDWFKLDWQDRATYVAYVENTNRHPQNFPEGSEAYDQWTYTGRKKKDKETLRRATQSNNP